ncbi:MAG TPA: hypothetical protein VFD82_14315 [Planctomycetota bacterium]|nr:hypothetical protein [Planctomycetota bacterium]
MSRRLVHLAAAALLLGALPPGQESTGSRPLLRVAANDTRWMEAFAQVFGLDMPALQQGQQLELLVPNSGAIRLLPSADPFRARTLVVDVRAAAWLQREAEAVATTERQLTTRVDAFAKLAALPAKAARELCASVFSLARSLESANVVVTQIDGGRRYDIRLELVPMPDSAFARWLAAVAPAAMSQPHLGWPDAALRLDLALARDCFPVVCAPFLPLIAAAGIHRSGAGAAEDELRALLPLLDGSFQLAFAPGRLGFAYGLHDADAFAARTLDPKHLQQETEVLGSQGIEAEFTPAALAWREVPMLRSRVRGRQPLPGLGNEDGDLVSFGARVGNLWLQIGGGNAPQDSMKRAIDDALDAKVRDPAAASSETASSAWLTCEIDLDRLGATAKAPRDAASTPDTPSRVCLSLRSSPQSLKALIQLR